MAQEEHAEEHLARLQEQMEELNAMVERAKNINTNVRGCKMLCRAWFSCVEAHWCTLTCLSSSLLPRTGGNATQSPSQAVWETHGCWMLVLIILAPGLLLVWVPSAGSASRLEGHQLRPAAPAPEAAHPVPWCVTAEAGALLVQWSSIYDICELRRAFAVFLMLSHSQAW